MGDTMKLHEMKSELDAIEQEIIDAGGEIFEGQEKRLAELVPMTKDKLRGYGFKYLDFDPNIAALEAESHQPQADLA